MFNPMKFFVEYTNKVSKSPSLVTGGVYVSFPTGFTLKGYRLITSVFDRKEQVCGQHL